MSSPEPFVWSLAAIAAAIACAIGLASGEGTLKVGFGVEMIATAHSLQPSCVPAT